MSKKINISDKDSQKELLGTILPEKTVENLFNTYDDVVSLLENIGLMGVHYPQILNNIIDVLNNKSNRTNSAE